MAENYPIDFVILWVDDSDPEWRAEKRKYQLGGEGAKQDSDSIDISEARYRDWGTLKYVFRGIEKFAPWVNKVFFVTCGHVPAWLNLDAPKLVHVKHADYMPAEYLPTFSANPIELNLHRIEGLSEHFVFFNDDTFITRPVETTLFFRDGKPMHHSELYPILDRNNAQVMPHIHLNDIALINRHFDCKETLSKNPWKWFDPRSHGKTALWHNLIFAKYHPFPGIRNDHLPSPILKSTMETVWNEEYETLHATSLRRFRDMRDVNQYIFRYWQTVSGNFLPIRRQQVGKYHGIMDNLDVISSAIREQKYPLLCVNDGGFIKTADEFIRARDAIIESFEAILPEQSSFER